MAKTSRHAKKDPFTLDVSNLIRHHQGEIKARESQRSGAFEDRDAALAELEDLKADSPEAREAKIKHSDAERKLETLSALVKWHRKQLAEAIEKADEGQFDFMYNIDEDEDAQLTLHKPKKAEKPAAPAEEPKPKKPVGRVPKADADAAIDGLNEHLKASVTELEVNDRIKNKLVAAGFNTMRDIAEVFFAHEGKDAFVEKFNANQNDTAASIRAINAWFTAQKKAELATADA